MDTQTTPIIQLVSIDGKPTTTSLEVARHFGKPHYDVLKAIRELLAQLPAHHQGNFSLMFRIVETGKGAIRNDPAYRITRTGFVLLAMGFTGKKALAFKLAYIDAFDRMEAQLQAQAQATGRPQAGQPRYMGEEWFACLQAQAEVMGVATLARTLQVSRWTLSRVLHGTAYYHGDKGSYPTRVAVRTLQTFFSHKRHLHHAHAIALVRQQQQMGLQF